MAGVLSRFSSATATIIQQLKNSSINENTVKSTAFWLSVWKKWCLEKEIAAEISSFCCCSRNCDTEHRGKYPFDLPTDDTTLVTLG